MYCIQLCRSKAKGKVELSEWANDEEEDDYRDFADKPLSKTSVDKLKGTTRSSMDDDDHDTETTLRPSGSRVGLIPLNASKSTSELPPLNASKGGRASGWGAPQSPKAADRSMETEEKSEEEEEYSMQEESVEEDDFNGNKDKSKSDDDDDFFGSVGPQKSVQPTSSKSAAPAPVKSLFSAPTNKPAPKPAPAVEDDGYGDDFEDYGDDFEDDGFTSSSKPKNSAKSKAAAAEPESDEVEDDIEEEISVGGQEVREKCKYISAFVIQNTDSICHYCSRMTVVSDRPSLRRTSRPWLHPRGARPARVVKTRKERDSRTLTGSWRPSRARTTT